MPHLENHVGSARPIGIQVGLVPRGLQDLMPGQRQQYEQPGFRQIGYRAGVIPETRSASSMITAVGFIAAREGWISGT